MADQQVQDPPGVDPGMRLDVWIEDHTGNKKRRARIAAHAPVHQLVPALVQTLGLRATDDAGRPVTYHLAFRDQQLKGEDTLAAVGVTEGATVTLVPVLIAG